MPHCPHCQTSLQTLRQREGILYRCPTCDGRALTVPQIRRMAGERVATSLLRQINRATQPTRLPCPFCTRSLRQVTSTEPPLELDTCRTCGVVWFDPHEIEALPEGVIESSDSMRLRAAEAIALHRLEIERERNHMTSGPDDEWKAIPALFGFPVE